MNCHGCYCNTLSQPPCYPCLNCNHYYVKDCALDCQECTYDHDRTGPFKLKDGSWSDGVGRGRPIRDAPRYSTVTNPGYRRQCVWKHESAHWVVDIPSSMDKIATHAEAIAYADKVARDV